MIVVIGSNGQLGSEFMRKLPAGTIAIPGPMSLQDMRHHLDKLCPEIIINCAAYTDVDGAEQHREEAFQANVELPRLLCDIASKSHAKLIHVCTDYVFNGNGEGPKVESMIPQPKGVYAESKYQGTEIILQYPHSYVLRTSGLYDINNSNSFVQKILRAANSRKEQGISVVIDQIVNPTSVQFFVQVAKEIISHAPCGRIINVCSTPVSWYEFAYHVLEINNVNTYINPVTTDAYNKSLNKMAAARPIHSYLLTDKMIEYLRYEGKEEIIPQILWFKQLDRAYEQSAMQ